jgi:lipopolysaccharide assembly outer membrane protein LptD (OstA)
VIDSRLRYKYSRFLTVVAVLTLFAVLQMCRLGLAQDQKPAGEPDYKDVSLKADLVKRNWGAKKMVFLTGNVVITQGDTVIKSDKIEYDEDTQIAKSPGQISITDPDNDIRGDSGIAYLKQRRGSLDGNVKLITKPKQKTGATDKSAEWRDPVTVTCNTIEYLYKQKQATASGNLKMLQKERTVMADKAVYLVKDERMTLTGNVHGSDEKGQSMTAGGKVTVSMKEGDEWIEMEQAAGTFKVKSEEEPAPTTPTPSPAK